MTYLFETKIGHAKDGSWAYALKDFISGRCVASRAGFGSADFARDAADGAKRRIASEEMQAAA